jgi:hypothetical protein
MARNQTGRPIGKGDQQAKQTARFILARRPLPRQSSVRPALTTNRRRRAKTMTDTLSGIRRLLRAMPERSDFDVTTLGELKALTDDLDDAIRAGVQHARRLGYSWAEIARELEVTKQTAWERWGP